MPKRKSVRRNHHRIQSKSSTLYRTKIFYFVGLAVFALFLVAQAVKPHSVSQRVLSDTTESDNHETQTPEVRETRGTTPAEASKTEGTIQQRETETQTSTGTVIKIKTEDNGAFKIEETTPEFQFKLEDQNGNAQFHVEDTKGNDLHESDKEKLEADLEKEGIDISTEDGKFALTKNNVKALSDMPLSVDKTRKQILVTTPNGNTVPLLLPDAALEHLTNFGILTNFGSGSAVLHTGSPSGALTLSSTNNIPTYAVPGFKDEKLLGLFPVQIPVSAVMSAQTGALMEQNEDFFSKLLDAVSF